MMKPEPIVSDPTALQDLKTRLRTVRRKLLTPAPRLNLSEWASRYRYISAEYTATPGFYHWDLAPYQKEIMDVAGDHRVRQMVVMSSAQVGKTTVLENIIAYYMANDPAPIMMVMPTLTDAKDFSSARIELMCKDSPILRGLLKDKRVRDSGNTVMRKQFPGGMLYFTAANSPTGLRAKSIRVLLLDEVDAYPASTTGGKDGDPVTQAIARVTSFWNSKVILTSTPTIKDFSRIEKEFLQSDQRYFHIPCPHCGEYQRLVWENIKYENDDPTTAFLVCVKNGCVIDESEKPAMLRKGKWVASNPASPIPGFHISALYSNQPNASWKALVAQWLVVKKDRETLKGFINTKLGETFEDKGERIEAHVLMERMETYDAPCPTGVGVITAGVDIQGNRIEVAVWGHGARDEKWLLDTDQIFIDPGTEAAWNELATTLARRYKTKSGVEVGIRVAAVDSGYLTENVYKFVRRYNGNKNIKVIPVKGSTEAGRPILGKGKALLKQGVVLHTVGTDTAKDHIFSWLRVEEPGPGYVHIPDGVDREVLEQLTSEKVLRYTIGGRAVRRYEKTRERNEQLDMAVYALAALYTFNPKTLAKLEEQARKLADSPPPDVTDGSSDPATELTPTIIPAPEVTPTPQKVIQKRPTRFTVGGLGRRRW